MPQPSNGAYPELAEKLKAADIAPLLMVYVQLSGDRELLHEFKPHIKGPWPWDESAPTELKERLRARTAALLAQIQSGRRQPADPPAASLLGEMASTCVGQVVPDDYLPLIAHEMQLAGTPLLEVDWRSARPEAASKFRVLIIGAGESGLCMGIKLARLGIDFTILEKNRTVGGT